MNNVIGFLCVICFFGYVARAAVELLSSVFFWGVAAIVVLTLLVFLTHH
ncbi:hypothetical protein ABH935_007166 [Catenulispora sp. GAS73]